MTTYFAQSSTNINAANVWNTAANGSGTALTWPPASGDVLMANNRTITVNVDTNLGATGEVRNDTTGGATAGGYFQLNSAVTLTANVYASSASPQLCVAFSSPAPNTAYLVGNVYANTSGNSGVQNNNTGTLSITGSVYGGTATNSYAAENTTTGVLNIAQNATGGSGISSHGVRNTGGGTVNVLGNVLGGTNSSGHGLFNNSTGTVNVNGSSTGGSAGSGALNNSSGTINVAQAIGNAFGNGSVGLSSAPGVSNSQTGTCKVKSIQYGARGQTPTVGPIFIEPDNANQAIFVKSDLTTLTLARTDGTAFGIPAEANVRYGTSYALGNKTGTCHVPTASQVSAGIAVDHTTGTAVITEANVKAAIWDAATSSLTTAGSIGERLKNCATVESTGEQLEGML